MNLGYEAKNNAKIYIGLGFIAVFTLMIMVTWLSMSSLHSVNSSMSALVESTNQRTTYAYQMRDIIRLRSNNVHELVSEQKASERHVIFNRLIHYAEDYQRARIELDTVKPNQREQEVLDKIDSANARVNEIIRTTSEHIYDTEQTSETLDLLLGDLEIQVLILLNHLNGLVILEKYLAIELLEDNQQKYKETRQLLILMVIASFTLSMLIAGIVIARVNRANKKIFHLANHDDLTGLNNRRSFEQHLEYTINNAGRSPIAHALLFIDLDRFKSVNDTCGHQAGDRLLIELTELMTSRLRKGDLFARLGGDEFGIIAQGDSFNDIQALAEELRQLVSDFTFNYENQCFNVSLSIGLTLIDGKVDSIERVLADVDAACYVAKKSGRNRVHVKQDNDADLTRYRTNLAGVQEIREALKNDQLALFYQPIYNVRGDLSEMDYCEILLRIKSESGEFYSPSTAISIAEKYNIMTDIDRWVFNNAIDWLLMAQKNRVVPHLLINLSGHSFSDEVFSECVIARLKNIDIDPSCITFEISEESIVKNFDQLKKFTNRIRTLGCQLALDNFGSGYSNFSYLKELSIDYLKIDGSLVSDIATNKVNRNMVAAINQMGHTVGALTIAESVEDDDSMQYLKDMNVDFAQGFSLKVPMPLDQLTDKLPVRDLSNSDSSSDDSAANSDSFDSLENDEFKKAS